MATFIQTVDFTVEVPDAFCDPDEDGSGFTMEVPWEAIRIDNIDAHGEVNGARVTGHRTTNVERVDREEDEE